MILLIIAISKTGSLLGGGFGIATEIVMELQELVIIAVVPLLLGLIWNRWAGGESGFLLGSICALYWAPSYRNYQGDGPLLVYVVSAMLIGCMAGALNNRADNFLRGNLWDGYSYDRGALLFGIFFLSPINVVTGVEGFLLTVLTRTAFGAIMSLVAKVFTWYGMKVNKKTMVE